MNKALVLVLGICLLATSALATPTGDFTSGWGNCTPGGNYGGWDQSSTCKVAWDKPCTTESRDATFTVGQDGYFTTKITIQHLDGVAETLDSFEVRDGTTVLCSFTDATSGTETWRTLECPVNLAGVKILTFHPTAASAWSGCDTWGQVAVKSITYEVDGVIPEFSAITAGLALAGAGAGFILLRKRK